MRMDTPVANGDPTLGALIPEGVTLAHIIALFQDAYPVNGEQLLRARLSALGVTHPANLAPPELAEFIKYVLAALKSAGIRDPAAVLANGLRLEAEAAAAKLGSWGLRVLAPATGGPDNDHRKPLRRARA
jgi:hypothetical protein